MSLLRRHARHRAAFSLIEMLVAIVIMSIIAGAAVFSFKKPLRAARIHDAREQVRYLDRSARQYARRFGRPVDLVFDLSHSTLARRDTNGTAGRITYQSAFPVGYQIESVRTAGRRSTGGEIAVPCSSLGLTNSYALHLIGPGLDEWVLVAGLAGEMTTLHDEHAIDSIFQTDSRATAARNDTD
jgi:prepilin-type N-terminal cleavage/methylation domain-containing protein